MYNSSVHLCIALFIFIDWLVGIHIIIELISFFTLLGSYENTGWTEQLSLPKKKPWTRMQTLPTAPGGPIICTYCTVRTLFLFLLTFYCFKFYWFVVYFLFGSITILFYESSNYRVLIISYLPFSCSNYHQFFILPSWYYSLFYLSFLIFFPFLSAVCLDTSWSMAGPRENLAKAVVLECSKQGT